MQLSYHAYHLVDRATGQRYRVNIQPFISGFVAWANADFKNQFSHGGESVFLLPAIGSVYLFVQARENEIIKRIQRIPLSVGEIRDALGDDESIGFASFIYLQEDYLAIGSTVLAPRMRAFSNYMNELLRRLEITLAFETTAITHSLPKAEVQRLTHVGTFSMKITSQNRLWDTIVGSFGAGDRADFDIGSIEITVRPAVHRGNTRRALVAAIETIGDQGLESFDARAKIEVADKMADFFIVGAGGVRDPIDTTDERTIANQILHAADNNPVLRDRLHDFRQDPDVTIVADPSALGIAWPPAAAVALGSDEDAP